MPVLQSISCRKVGDVLSCSNTGTNASSEWCIQTEAAETQYRYLWVIAGQSHV